MSGISCGIVSVGLAVLAWPSVWSGSATRAAGSRPPSETLPLPGGEFMKSSTPRDAVRLSPNAITVLEKRYLLKDETGTPVESPSDLFWRVARTVAQADARYGASAEQVDAGGRRLLRPHGQPPLRAQLAHPDECRAAPWASCPPASCFRWTMRSPTARAASTTPCGPWRWCTSRVAAPGSASPGFVPRTTSCAPPWAWPRARSPSCRLFDASTDVVKQGGTRRGANMGILRVDHPDILEFITCKDDTTKITNFNISVAVTDAFMAAVEADGLLRSDPSQDRPGHRPAQGPRSLGADHPRRLEDRRAGRVLHRRPTTTTRFPIWASTRPPIPAGSSRCCPTMSATWGRSISARLSRRGRGQTGRRSTGIELRRVVHLSTHFLENVIDANQYPLPEITDLAQRIRRIGLGVMGLADVFVKLGVPYDSDEGVALGRKIQQFVDEEAKVESERLAAERGVFPEWERSIWGPDETCARDAKGERVRPMRRLRNCNVTTVAPTGTISIIAGCSSGIEPLFAVAFMRNQAGVLMPDVNEDFVAIAKAEGWYSDELMRKIAEAGPHRFPRGAGQVAAGLRHRQRHQARVAHPDAGGVPGVQRQRHLQDLQLRPRRHRGIRRGDLPAGLSAELQGRDGLPRWQPGHAGAVDRVDRQEGHGAARQERKRPGTAGLPASTRATADLHGEIAELRAENERLAADRARAGVREPPAAAEALPARGPARHHPPGRDAARHALRHHHRGRQGPALRGLHDAWARPAAP